jgi:hypothetical protein
MQIIVWMSPWNVLHLCLRHEGGPLKGMHLKIEGAGGEVDDLLNKSMHVLDLCFLRAGGPLQGVHMKVEGAGLIRIIV